MLARTKRYLMPRKPLRRRRSGSVLILVVALLVLLALMGTAFISSSRSERGTAVQNNANTQADLLLQGLVQATQASTVGELYGMTAGPSNTVYRPPLVDVGAGSTKAQNFYDYSSPGSSLFLADRTPRSVGGSYQWDQVSWPLFTNNAGTYQFDSPYTTTPAIFAPNTAPGAVALKSQTANNTIGSVLIAGSGQVVPTLSVNGTVIVAADADGDGIADSGLFKLPVSPIDGITYYGAIRVIDGNSAVNANTALDSAEDYAAVGAPSIVDAEGTTPGGTAPVGFFPSSVGLLSLLTDNSMTVNSDLPRAEYAIFDQKLSPVPFPTNPTPTLSLDVPVTDYQTQRGDFRFTTLGEMLSSQLTRRLNNPGYFNVSGTYYPLTPFSLNDAAALASGFCIKSSGSAGSDIETWMRNSLTNTTAAPNLIHTTAYQPNDFINWYNTNFSYGGVTRMPVRSLLTTWNPVADYAPQHYVKRTVRVAGGAAANTVIKKQPLNARMLPYDPDEYQTPGFTYGVGEFVKYRTSSNAPYRCYECLTAGTPTAPIVAGALDYANWREEPWTEQPTKANINTADFPTLWRAFYNVMADSSQSTVYESNGDSTPPMPNTVLPVPHDSFAVPTATGGTPWGPFRDPSRSPATPTPLTACEMVQLRAAIAAVNALDLRDSDDDITSRTINIYADPSIDQSGALPAFTATVYGTEMQPFISAVSADYDYGANTGGVSIELYNPTDQVMDVSNWQLASLSRAAGVITLATLSPTAPLPSLPAGTMVPPNGYLVIQSTAPVANYTPAAGEASVTVGGLETVVAPGAVASEVVLLRPRLFNNTASPASTAVDNSFTGEGTPAAPTYQNMVPVDSVDFANVFPAGGVGHVYQVYERPHGHDPVGPTDDFNWQFVHPGKYDPAAAAPQTKQYGWQAATTAGAAAFTGGTFTNKVLTNPMVSTRAANGNAATFPFAAIQLATRTPTNTWVGKNRTITAAGNRFPYSGFARNGDILKVPFIGAYTVVNAAGQIVAMNSITADATVADAASSLDVAGKAALAGDARSDEAIGRFVPLAAINPSLALGAYKPTVNASTGVTTLNDPYGWAAKIFDYVDVQVANDDDFPNVDPRLTDGSNVNYTTIPHSAYGGTNPPKYPDALGTVGAPNTVASTVAIPVGNQTADPTRANGTFEQSVGKQGLININTAPSFVLAQLPGVSQGMADAIIADRQTNGPFRTIFDLNRVDIGNPADGFQGEGGLIKLSVPPVPPATSPTPDNSLANDPGLDRGDFTPQPGLAAGYDGVRNDFEEKTLMLTRISNLITTRSDTFTCYVLLQGWRNAGTANASMVVQRRAAFILDRTNVTASNNRPQTFTVPTP